MLNFLNCSLLRYSRINLVRIFILLLFISFQHQSYSQIQSNAWLSDTTYIITDVCWSPSGEKALSVGYDLGVTLWDNITGEIEVVLYGHSFSFIPILKSVDWSHSGNKFASGGASEIVIWDAQNYSVLNNFLVGDAWIGSLAWSPDDKLLAFESKGIVFVIDPANGIVVSSFALSMPNNIGSKIPVCWLNDSTLLVGSINGELTAYSLESNSIIFNGKYSETTYGIYDIAISPDGQTASLASYQNLYLVNTINFELVHTLKVSQDFLFGTAWSPDGRFLTGSGHWSQLRLYDAVTYEKVGLIPFPKDTITASNHSVSWSPSGKQLLVGSNLPGGFGCVSVWNLDLSPVTSVNPDTDDLPKLFSLEQNYPNPFNPSTTINFSIPQSDFTTLKVFSLLGEEIVTLISEHLQAGSHSVRFDASNLQSGVYFYTLQNGSSRISKKMILLK